MQGWCDARRRDRSIAINENLWSRDTAPGPYHPGMSFTVAEPTGDRVEDYRRLVAQAAALIEGEPDRVANAANLSALIYHSLPEVNWAGFYFAAGDELVVGPFQGKPACVRIAFGKGVCGTAAATRTTQLVSDVHAFPGHIACDADSRSEIVVPLVRDDTVIGVLDLDSPRPGRFDTVDRDGLEAVAGVFLDAL
ncbi:GAF domain-containing protein [Nocardia farcinica]|uniref:Free methionine-R-sulfoxide reductase n=2 Tax=Nocardia farcinica TaxID=37329 RepID=A0A0H5P0M9_NOCFR|nr:Free methionine-R-sulfoxide reductase [Nocardia farcinica]SIT13522.1 GAF domain-containing protein [Nocardia farcinica]